MNKLSFFISQIFLASSICYAERAASLSSPMHQIVKEANKFFAYQNRVFGVSQGLMPSSFMADISYFIQNSFKNAEKIKKDIEKQDWKFKLFNRQKSYEQIVRERDEKIKQLKSKIQKVRQFGFNPTGEESEEEMQAELYELQTAPVKPELFSEIANENGPLSDFRPEVLEQSPNSAPYTPPDIRLLPSSPKPADSHEKHDVQESVESKSGESSTSCHSCKKSFGLTRWKYSCKTCGVTVCASCLNNTHQHGHDDVSERLLGTKSEHLSSQAGGVANVSLSAREHYAATNQFKEIMYFSEKKPYWPRRYRTIFRKILNSTQAKQELLDSLAAPIAKDTKNISPVTKKEIQELVKAAWKSHRELCMRACLEPMDSIGEDLTPDSLANFRPSDFEDYDQGSRMAPELKKLLDRLLGSVVPCSFNYDSETLIINVPHNTREPDALRRRFEPYEKFFTLNFVTSTRRGACFSCESAGNDFCSKFISKGLGTTIGGILTRGVNEKLALTGYHAKERNLSKNETVSIKELGSRAVFGHQDVDLLFLKASPESFNLVAFSSFIYLSKLEELIKKKHAISCF
ncbi:MAG: FYVE zinc finger domain-containing protein [Myxococcaceae bacterium]|nr:FYVE zinc finger domain-containing protein [Myxococcaceae bacterium]MBH2006610.1 FYVE zinc finger domain-containing protein [Myxococcaceae bacterium]